jgi:hypothetical protein
MRCFITLSPDITKLLEHIAQQEHRNVRQQLEYLLSKTISEALREVESVQEENVCVHQID